MNNIALLIPILVPLGLFAMIFGIYHLKNKERMTMIERGMDPNADLPKQRQSNPAFTLTFGLLLIGSGLGLFIAFMLNQWVFTDRGIDSDAVYFGLIAIFGGIGLLISYFIENKANKQKEL
ncbi:MAG: DUF6249 domain-containing protein [Mucilaginibacter sp.]|uniref:DUF6249 domain-containing protein n=1 Tax=Mucilaginibacter sp. TaxID=1882438 RepID=UPI0034E53547